MGFLDSEHSDCNFCNRGCMICYSRRVKKLEEALNSIARSTNGLIRNKANKALEYK